jgi:hypothetical protein
MYTRLLNLVQFLLCSSKQSILWRVVIATTAHEAQFYRSENKILSVFLASAEEPPQILNF